MKRKKPLISTILYVVSVIMLITFLFNLYQSIMYIYELISEGSLTFVDSWQDIIVYISSNTFSYLVYTLVLWACGYITKTITTTSLATQDIIEEITDEKTTENHEQDLNDDITE